MSDVEELCLVLMWAYLDSLARIDQLYNQLDEAELKASVARRLSFDSYASPMSETHTSDGNESLGEHDGSFGRESSEDPFQSPTHTPSLEAHQEYIDVEAPTHTATTVVQAIHSAAQDRIYTLLLEMVTTIPAAKALAEERLLVTMKAAEKSEPDSKSFKRKAYEICKNCKSEYSVDVNHKGSCVYHDGYKTVDDDSETWADHDDACHGPPDAHENDPDYEDGFMWSCCEEPISSAGCNVSRHEPKEDETSKKARKI